MNFLKKKQNLYINFFTKTFLFLKKKQYIYPNLVRFKKLDSLSSSFGLNIVTVVTKKKKTKTFSRSSTILPKHIDLNINIYNGRRFIPVKIKENMVGHKLGEFALTRLPFKYKK